MERLHPMELIWLFIGGVVLAGALFALSGRFENWRQGRNFVDKDADGEPDEPNGPAKDL